MERDLSAMGTFKDWPVFELLHDPQVLWTFLQERWLLYLHAKGMLDGAEPTMKISGPRQIPFDSPALQVYWDNLFDEGLLKVVDCGDKQIPQEWWRIGVFCPDDAKGFSHDRLPKLVGELPESGASYREWIQFGLKYSRVVADLFSCDNKATIQSFWDKVWPAVDERFSAWVQDGYLGIYNLPPSPPKMVHHIPKQLLRWNNDGEKVALVVLDGLSCAGWLALRDQIFSETDDRLEIEESAAFAWLPSLTPMGNSFERSRSFATSARYARQSATPPSAKWPPASRMTSTGCCFRSPDLRLS